MEVFETHLQGIVKKIEQVDNNLSVVSLDSLQGDFKECNFIFYGLIDRDLSGEVVRVRSYATYDNLTGSHQRVQSIEVGSDKFWYVSSVPEQDTLKLRKKAYQENPLAMRDLQLVA